MRRPMARGVPRQARAAPAQDAAGARPRSALVLRVGRAARPVGVERRGRLVELGARVPALGRAQRVRGSTSRSAPTSRPCPGCSTATACSHRVGHDEYWSWGMREALDAHTAARRQRRHLQSGNTCYWQVRFDHDAGTMTCFKYSSEDDPVLAGRDVRRRAARGRIGSIGRPETLTIGLTFTRGGYSRYGLGVPRASGAYTVHRPEHWLVRGHRAAVRRRAGARRHDRRLRGRRVRDAARTPTDCPSRPTPTAPPQSARDPRDRAGAAVGTTGAAVPLRA